MTPLRPAAGHGSVALRTDWRERYEVIGQIGRGGSADVYEAYDRALDRRVAIKMIPNERGMSPRVLREVQAAAALSHPGIVALYDWFSDGEQSYIVCELVDGDSLDRLVGQLRDSDVVAIGAELLEALALAHSQGIVHRDVKPQNVMLDREGHVKVMDFGIALLSDTDTLTQDGDVVGTVAYMSPEQAAGRRVGPPTDVYSAGVVLYELLAGAHPLRGETPAETLANVSAARLPSLAELRPDLPGDLVEVIDGACAARPAQRPSAADLAAALRRQLESGDLGGRWWRKVRARARAVAPLGPAAERVGGAVLATVAAVAVLGSLPAYPPSWTLPLLAIGAALWAVVPRVGLAWLLGILAFPFFNVSLSVGLVYLTAAVALFLSAGRRPLTIVWPVLGMVLAPLYLTLLAPAGARLLGRVRGPLTAAWAGAATYLYLLLVDEPGPFTMFQSASDLADRVVAAESPVSVATTLAGALLTPAGLLQTAVWAGAAAALGFAATARSLELRLWGWALCFAGVYLTYTVVPGGEWADVVNLDVVVLHVGAAASVVLLPLALWSAGRPEELDDEHLQGD